MPEDDSRPSLPTCNVSTERSESEASETSSCRSHRSASPSSSEEEEENSTDSSEECVEEIATRIRQRNCPCDICHKRFLSRSQLSTHMRVHTGEKPFTCEICGHQSTQKFNLKKHILAVHDQVKDFECNVCDKRFAQKNDLSDHINTHTGAKPFKCGQCPQRFAASGGLRQHRKSHFAPTYKCEYCRKMFVKPNHLKRHRDGDKEQGGRIACTVRRQQIEQQKSNRRFLRTSLRSATEWLKLMAWCLLSLFFLYFFILNFTRFDHFFSFLNSLALPLSPCFTLLLKERRRNHFYIRSWILPIFGLYKVWI